MSVEGPLTITQLEAVLHCCHQKVHFVLIQSYN